ncbi:MAG TPA: hypothetical protein VJH37_04245 [Candidatus Nanoarchaeia archaeon]|nr:hypothetical protein [Candidatus Nanoarchaeia archaeon]
MISLQRLLYWAFLLFLIYLAFELARKLLGGSLGFEELVIGLLVANLGYSYHINTKLSEHIGWHRGKETSS